MFAPSELQDKIAALRAAQMPEISNKFTHNNVCEHASRVSKMAARARQKLKLTSEDVQVEISKASITNYRWSLREIGRPFRDTMGKLRQMVNNKMSALVDELRTGIAEERAYAYSALREITEHEAKLQKLMIEVELHHGEPGYIDAKSAILKARSACLSSIALFRESFDTLDRVSLEIDSHIETLYSRLRMISAALVLTYTAWINDGKNVMAIGRPLHSDPHLLSRDLMWEKQMQSAVLHALNGKDRRKDLEKALFETLKNHESYSTLRVIANSEAYPPSMRLSARNSLDDMRCSLAQSSYEKIMSIKRKPVPPRSMRQTMNAFRH